MSNIGFSSPLDSLLSGYIGVDAEGVGHILKDSAREDRYPCYVCGKPSKHRIIPRPGTPLTAEIQDRGFICEFHISERCLDSTRYKLEEIK